MPKNKITKRRFRYSTRPRLRLPIDTPFKRKLGDPRFEKARRTWILGIVRTGAK